MNSLPCVNTMRADSHARELDAKDRSDEYGWMRTGQLTSDAKWVSDTIGEIAPRYWEAIAEALADGDQCEAGRILHHALERHAIAEVLRRDGIDLRNAEYLIEGVEP